MVYRDSFSLQRSRWPLVFSDIYGCLSNGIQQERQSTSSFDHSHGGLASQRLVMDVGNELSQISPHPETTIVLLEPINQAESRLDVGTATLTALTADLVWRPDEGGAVCRLKVR